MTTFLFYGDTIRYPAIRHELPLAIMDPLLLVVRGEDRFVLTTSLEAARVRQVLPQAQQLLTDELGVFELIGEGMTRDDAELEVAVRESAL
jgi:hypothetical protein